MNGRLVAGRPEKKGRTNRGNVAYDGLQDLSFERLSSVLLGGSADEAAPLSAALSTRCAGGVLSDVDIGEVYKAFKTGRWLI